MRKIIAFCVMLSVGFGIQAQEEENGVDLDSVQLMVAAYQHYVDSMEATFDYEYGTVEISEGIASINVPEGFKFLSAEQANYVLTDLWGNPPSQSLGMLFPKEESPVNSSTYAVELTYEADGYINDEDASDIDYDELLEEMQEDQVEVNKERVKAGYEEIDFVGWASAPFYDAETKKLHWAREIKFGDAEVNTLNYNIRILGRKGHLRLNVISEMDALPKVKEDIDVLLASVEFNQGNRYADFNPELDEVAAYGIGGLVAGKLLAKAGIFVFLAKFWKIGALAVVGFFGLIRKKLFGGKSEE